jgi:anti-sigma factor RsiW
MNVARNVIYDLLPAYFAGEVSGDTRTLVEAFLETDPELRRMAERFRERMQDRVGIDLTGADNERERAVFHQARARFNFRQATLA